MSDLKISISLGFVEIILSALMIYNGHNWGGDFSQFIAQSIAIVEGKIDLQIANNTWIIKNSFDGLGPYIYPWGVSLLLAPLYVIFGFHLVAFKLLFCVLFGIFVAVFYYFCRYYFCGLFMERKFCIIASLLFALNPIFLYFSNAIRSDIPFMLFSLIAIMYLGKLLTFGDSKYLSDSAISKDSAIFSDSKKSSDSNIPSDSINFSKIANRGGGQTHKLALLYYAIFGGIFVSLAYITRNNGIIIMIALLLCHILLIFKNPNIFKNPKTFNKFHIFCHALPYIIFIITNLTINSILGVGGSGHLELLSQFTIKTIIRNFFYYVWIFGDFFALNYIGFAIFLLSIPLIFNGIKLCFHKAKIQTIFIALFILGNMALLVLWVGLQGIRFVFCVIPFIMLFGIIGFVNTTRFKNAIKICFLAIILLFIAKDFYHISLNIKNHFNYKEYDAYSDDAKDIYAFIKAQIPQDSKLAFFKPRVLYLNTNRLSFYPLNDEDFSKSDFILEYLPLEYARLLPKDKTKITKIYENSEFILYATNSATKHN